MRDPEPLPRRGKSNPSSGSPGRAERPRQHGRGPRPAASAEDAWKGPLESDDDETSGGGWWGVGTEADGSRDPEGVETAHREAPPVVDVSKSKRELYQEAKEAGIEGRSAMSKEQLAEALQRHHAAISSRRPTRQAPGAAGRTGSGRQLRPDRERVSREPERCAVVYRGSDREGEFHVVVTEADGSLRSAARSPAFRVRAGEIPRNGTARAAHELLVQRLVASGWWPAGSGEAWPTLEFVRVDPTGEDDARSLITVVREGGQARFVAEELDNFGNPRPIVASDAFSAPRLLPVRPTRQAKAALNQLLELLEPDGWEVAEQIGSEWYAISLRMNRPD